MSIRAFTVPKKPGTRMFANDARIFADGHVALGRHYRNSQEEGYPRKFAFDPRKIRVPGFRMFA